MEENTTQKQVERAKIVANDHEYEFVLLDAIHGLGVYHEWLRYFTNDIDKYVSAVREMIQEADEDIGAPELFKRLISGDDAFLKLRELLVKVLGFDKLIQLCTTFLAGAIIDGEECDEFGLCPMMRNQPHEVYTAIIMAVAANYPDYFPFITEGLDTGESPSPK